MSTKYKHGDVVPSEVLSARLLELAHAATKSGREFEREFNMRIPAELDRDADLVLSQSADRIEQLQRERDGLITEVHNLRFETNTGTEAIAELQAKAVEGFVEWFIKSRKLSYTPAWENTNEYLFRLAHNDYANTLRKGSSESDGGVG